MKAHLEGDKLSLTAETQEERAALHEFKFRGGVKAMRLHRCIESDSELELTLSQSTFAIHDSSPVEAPEIREALTGLLEELQRCSDLVRRFLG